MKFLKTALAPGLYFVGVPIGTARDITLRALDTLAAADLLAAEDTRSLRRLMEIHGVPLNGRKVIALHDHSGTSVQERLIAAVREGKSVAYASEAGMPLIADPGFADPATVRKIAAEMGERVDRKRALVVRGQAALVMELLGDAIEDSRFCRKASLCALLIGIDEDLKSWASSMVPMLRALGEGGEGGEGDSMDALLETAARDVAAALHSRDAAAIGRLHQRLYQFLDFGEMRVMMPRAFVAALERFDALRCARVLGALSPQLAKLAAAIPPYVAALRLARCWPP